MRYKNLIIKCSDIDEIKKLQKYLFRYSYTWCEDNGLRHHHIKKLNPLFFSIVIHNDDVLYFVNNDLLNNDRYSKYKTTYFAKLLRKDKLIKINNEITL